MWPPRSLLAVIVATAVGLVFVFLVIAIVRARRALTLRTQAFAAACHDLLTPLTRLRLRTERVSATLREGMLRDIDRMDRMLREVLESLAHETRSLTENVDLVSLLRTICSEFADVGHTVTYDGPQRLTIRANAAALTRAITNTIAIEVCDDGPGIPKEQRKKVFDPFYTHSRDARIDRSFGLGLGISRAIAERHGGTIVLGEREPRGLVARLSLPRSRIVRD
jgi:signal transduction histidine kinase